MKYRVLLAEDEITLATIISETLADEGYDVAVAADGMKGLEQFRNNGADIVLADVMMPEMDGFEMVRQIRKINASVPVVFLTARSAIEDIETGFGIGGNDYVKKPFSMRELMVRMQALLKRRSVPAIESGMADSPADRFCRLGEYVFDVTGHRLTVGDRRIELTHIEAMILSYLMAHMNETVRSSELMELVWKHDDYYNRNSLHGYIHKLRHHLRHDQSVAIINLRGIGYRLVVHAS